MSQDAFKCGHARTDDNIRLSHGRPTCRTCYRAWDTARRQRIDKDFARTVDTEQSRQRRVRKMIMEAAAAKPHLYPFPA